MQKTMSTEEAIKKGVHSKKVMQIAKEELGDNISKRRLLAYIREAESKAKQ